MSFQESEEDVACQQIVDISRTVGVQGSIVITLKHIYYLVEVIFMIRIDGFHTLMIHHHLELVVAHQKVMPLIVKLRNLKYSIINIMPDTLIIVRDVVMIGIAVDGNLTRHRLFVVL